MTIKKESTKVRKTINVSIQSKKYSNSINKIVNEWEENGLNVSTEVCDMILLMSKLKNTITFFNMFNMYELTEKIVGLYYDLDSPIANQKIEEILSEVIKIDNSKLTDVLANINKEANSKSNQINETQNTSKEDITEISADTDKYSKPLPKKHEETKTVINEEVSEDDEFTIPTDFFLNS